MRNLTIATIIILAVVLRFFQLGNVPPSPYWEEVALGYDAFSILKTGRDHHGHWFPLVAFESFGDWKPGFYIYSIVPSIFLFGLNTFSIRLPSALAGVSTVVGTGILAQQLFSTRKISDQRLDKSQRWLPIVIMLITAIEPWGILFSRGAWETNLATALILWAIICVFAQSQRAQNARIPRYLIISSLLTAFAMYTYHAARISAPLMVFAAFVFTENDQAKSWKNRIQRNIRLKRLLIPAVTICLLVFPLVSNLASNTVTNRFTTTSIFSDLSIITTSNHLKEIAGNSLVSRLLFHRYLLFGKEIVLNFLKNFDLGYLFLHGDTNPRHSIQFTGQLYPLSFILALLGLSTLFYRYRSRVLLFCCWFLFGLLPSTLVVGSPHAVRSLAIFPFWCMIIGIGLHRLVIWLSRTTAIKRNLSTSILSIVFIAQICAFWMYYTEIYPVKYSREWQYGYKEMIAEVNRLALKFPDDQIYITREQGRPAMYYWFYSQTDPRVVQAYDTSTVKDQSEFLQFGRLHFIDKPDQVASNFGILAASPSFSSDARLTEELESSTIYDLMGNPIWIVQQYEK